MIIRKYAPEDFDQISVLFYETIHTINAKDYTLEQVNAWATGKLNQCEWNRSLQEHYSLVAVVGYKIVGFGDIDNTGYLDHLYVHKDYQRQGIATAICKRLEQSVPVSKIFVHSSITAGPFFEKQGYKVLKEQQVERNGVFLKNYTMQKNKQS